MNDWRHAEPKGRKQHNQVMKSAKDSGNLHKMFMSYPNGKKVFGGGEDSECFVGKRIEELNKLVGEIILKFVDYKLDQSISDSIF